MNETLHPAAASDVPWPTSDHRVRVPDTSMLPGSENAPPPAVNLLNQAVQGAHDGLDRFADRAAPVARQLGQRISAAEDALQARSAQWRGTRDEWLEGARTTVRGKPLLAVAAAAALGAVIARLVR
jgi:ElaB/YqjD/DUF883 family membrane-anchored ribosome-binding protein